MAILENIHWREDLLKTSTTFGGIEIDFIIDEMGLKVRSRDHRFLHNLPECREKKVLMSELFDKSFEIEVDKNGVWLRGDISVEAQVAAKRMYYKEPFKHLMEGERNKEAIESLYGRFQKYTEAILNRNPL